MGPKVRAADRFVRSGGRRRRHHRRRARLRRAGRRRRRCRRGAGTRIVPAGAEPRSHLHDRATCGSSATPTSTRSCSSSGDPRACARSTGVELGQRRHGHPGQPRDPASEGLRCRRPRGRGANDLFLAVRAVADGRGRRGALEAGAQAIFAEPRPPPAAAAAEAPPADARRGVAARSRTANVAVDLGARRLRRAGGAQGAVGRACTCCCSATTSPSRTRSRSRTAPPRLGLLVMGPGAGTAMLGGTGLGFANVVEPGRVARRRRRGHRCAGGDDPARPLGRRRLARSSGSAGGTCPRRSAAGWRVAAVRAPRRRSRHRRRSCWSPSRRTRTWPAAVLAAAGGHPARRRADRRWPEPFAAPRGVTVDAHAGGRGAWRRVRALGGRRARPSRRGSPSAVRTAVAACPADRTLVRGPVLRRHALLRVAGAARPTCSATSTPTPRCAPSCGLPAPERRPPVPRPRRGGVHQGPAAPDDRPARPGSSCCASSGADPTVAAILLDVVLGHGAHADPAGALAPVCARDRSRTAARSSWSTSWAPAGPAGLRRASGPPAATPAASSPRPPPAPRSRPPRSPGANPTSPRRRSDGAASEPRIALVTLLDQAARRRSCTRSRSPRRCTAHGVDVHLVALGDPAAGLLPRRRRVPHTVAAGPVARGRPRSTTRVFAAIDALRGRARRHGRPVRRPARPGLHRRAGRGPGPRRRRQGSG